MSPRPLPASLVFPFNVLSWKTIHNIQFAECTVSRARFNGMRTSRVAVQTSPPPVSQTLSSPQAEALSPGPLALSWHPPSCLYEFDGSGKWGHLGLSFCDPVALLRVLPLPSPPPRCPRPSTDLGGETRRTLGPPAPHWTSLYRCVVIPSPSYAWASRGVQSPGTQQESLPGGWASHSRMAGSKGLCIFNLKRCL